jgi:hypothetical protein
MQPCGAVFLPSVILWPATLPDPAAEHAQGMIIPAPGWEAVYPAWRCGPGGAGAAPAGLRVFVRVEECRETSRTALGKVKARFRKPATSRPCRLAVAVNWRGAVVVRRAPDPGSAPEGGVRKEHLYVYRYRDNRVDRDHRAGRPHAAALMSRRPRIRLRQHRARPGTPWRPGHLGPQDNHVDGCCGGGGRGGHGRVRFRLRARRRSPDRTGSPANTALYDSTQLAVSGPAEGAG